MQPYLPSSKDQAYRQSQTHNKTTALNPCVEFYLDDCLARGQSNSTVNSKRRLLDLFCRWAISQGVDQVSDIGIDLLEQYRRYWYRYRKPKDNEPLEIATQHQRLGAVLVFLKKLAYYRIITDDAFSQFELPKVPLRLPQQIPNEGDVTKVLQQTLIKGRIGIRDRAILEVYYACGLRRAELANLNVNDVHFNHQILTIRKGKGGNDRNVPIADRALQAIRLYLNELRDDLATIDSGNALFLGETGKRMHCSKLTQLVGDYIRRAGVASKGACHLFRHATATHMLRNGADIRHVQEMLGHKDIKSTQLYTHVTIGDLKQVYDNTHPAALR